jgi:hypothetical protein
MEAGWSHFYLGATIVARPRGSYRQEDVRQVIAEVLHGHGLPDAFRFERGTWESNGILDLLRKIEVELITVYQSNHKPFIEGGFSKLWTYLSVIDGQVGRFRGEEEKNNLLIQKCRAGRADPRDHFPSLTQCKTAIQSAMALSNSDKVKSISGNWIPEVRHRELAAARPWAQLHPDLAYLFSPIVREWTVAKGHVSGRVTLSDDGLKVPFSFFHEDLWRSNGHLVRVYFDSVNPSTGGCTIVAMDTHAGYQPGDIICRAQPVDGGGLSLADFARAALGSATPPSPQTAQSNPNDSRGSSFNQVGGGSRRASQFSTPNSSLPTGRKAALSALRRETFSLAPGGRVSRSISELRAPNGDLQKIERNVARASTPASSEPSRLGPATARPIAAETLSPGRQVPTASEPEPEPDEEILSPGRHVPTASHDDPDEEIIFL